MSIFSKTMLVLAIFMLLRPSSDAQNIKQKQIPSIALTATKGIIPNNVVVRYGLEKNKRSSDIVIFRAQFLSKVKNIETIEFERYCEKYPEQCKSKDFSKSLVDNTVKPGVFYYYKVIIGKDVSNIDYGYITALALLDTPRILRVSDEFTDRIEIAYEGIELKPNQRIEVEYVEQEVSKDVNDTTLKFGTDFKTLDVLQKEGGVLIDKRTDLRPIKYKYRIRIAEGDINIGVKYSAWSNDVEGEIKEK